MDVVTIVSLAKELDIKPKDIKDLLGMVMTTPGSTELDADQIKTVVGDNLSDSADAVKKTVVKVAKKVIYFWGDSREHKFMADDKLNKTENSVMALCPKESPEAFLKLEKHPDNEANGGNKFKKMDKIGNDSSDGSSVDELMKLNHPQLVVLAGGGLDNQQKSVGTLILEIVDAAK